MDASHDLVVRTIREHAPALLRTARRHSLCSDDAHDAYQRALEIFLRRAPTLEPETVDRWLHVVVKHEAMAVRRARQELVAPDEHDLEARPAEREPDAEERILRWDRMSRSAEALQRLKPQELTALWLKAQGLSYQEIAERQQWSYTKVNRCITEGRRAFMTRYAGIEAGEECERWAPVVAALVDGEATAEQLAAARPHLRRCAGCRSTVREMRLAGPRLAGVLPVGVVGGAGVGAGAPGRWESVARGVESAVLSLHERVASWALKLQAGAEAASATKVAAVTASAAALASGGAVTVHQVRTAHERPAHAARVETAALRAGGGSAAVGGVAAALTTPGGGIASAGAASGSSGSGRTVGGRTARRGGGSGVAREFARMGVLAGGVSATREFRTGTVALPGPAPVRRHVEFRVAGGGAGVAGAAGAAASSARSATTPSAGSGLTAVEGGGRSGNSLVEASGHPTATVVEGGERARASEFGDG